MLALACFLAAPRLAAAQEVVVDSLYETAQQAYAEGRYTTAAELLEEAYRREPAPLLQHNLGRCYERLERWSDAARAYRMYLGSIADPEERARLERHAVELDAHARRAAEPVRVPSPASRVPHRDPELVGPLALVGGGIAVGLVGAAFAVGAFDAHDRAISSSRSEHASSQLDLANALGASATVAWAVGATLLISGIVWLAVEVTGAAQSGEAAHRGSEMRDVQF